MNNVQVLYIKNDAEKDYSQIKDQQVDNWLSQLAAEKRKSIERLVSRNDRITSLLATQMLRLAAGKQAVASFDLVNIYYPKTGKPIWKCSNAFLDFNISHSNNMIVVAVSKTMSVGVDVEKIKALKRLNFKMVLSKEEITQVQQYPNLFFNMWSKKEAVVKAADTVGIARMRGVELKEDYALLDGNTWHLKELHLDSHYVGYLATSQIVDEIDMTEIKIDALLDT